MLREGGESLHVISGHNQALGGNNSNMAIFDNPTKGERTAILGGSLFSLGKESLGTEISKASVTSARATVTYSKVGKVFTIAFWNN